MRSILFSALVLIMAPALPATSQDVDPKSVSGEWDFARKTRNFSVAAITRNDGNRYPGFWAGECVAGKLSIRSERGVFDDDLTYRSQGGFTIRLTHSARKQGMETKIPAGAWMHDLERVPVTLRLDRFTEWKPKQVKKQDMLEAKVSGMLIKGAAKTPLSGTARLRYARGLPVFKMEAELAFDGAMVGQSGPVRITVYTTSPVSNKAADSPELEFKLD